jgi:hypothetical protein
VTEIARYEDRHLAVAPTPEPTYPTDPTGGRLVAWADGLTAAHRIGSALCSTAFVPAHFKGKPEEAAAAILYGDEIGLTPTQALQNLYVISGKPALYARAMVALVLAAGHEVWTVSKSDASVTVAGRRRGSAHIIEETWTTARAAKAGYTNNKKYQTDPQSMLYARAASDVCRQVAPDALAGLAYSVEEVELSEDAPTTTVRRSERKTTAKRSAPTTPPEPDAEPPAVTVERADDRDGLVTPAQLTKIAAQMGDLGITDRDDALAYVADVIGRPIETRNDLTAAEASRLIDHMARALGEVPPTEEAPNA